MQKYTNRVKVLDASIAAKMTEDAPDVYVWQWLCKLVVDHLGEDGTSSDESEGEDLAIHMVYRKKRMIWRRDIDKELRLIDKERLRDRQNWSTQGSKPAPRCASELTSNRPAVTNLPRNLYNDKWYAALTSYQLTQLDVSEKPFIWYEIQQV